jgi:hybrid cluster-associated redox disulfide protein
MSYIDKESNVEDLLTAYPALTRVFIAHGLPCLVCGSPFWGTIAELAQKHTVDLGKLLKELNEKKRKIDEKI